MRSQRAHQLAGALLAVLLAASPGLALADDAIEAAASEAEVVATAGEAEEQQGESKEVAADAQKADEPVLAPQSDGAPWDGGTVAGTLTLGDTIDVSLAEEGAYYAFTPEEDGAYRFFSSDCEGDPWATLYDATGEELANDDDSAGSMNFSLPCVLEANKTYYLHANTWDSVDAYTLTVEKLEIPTSLEAVVREDAALAVGDPSKGYWSSKWDDEAGEDIPYFCFWSESVLATFDVTATYADGSQTMLSESDGLAVEYDCGDWQPGNSYPVTITYLGVTCTAMVPVVETSISFDPAEEYRLIENVDGYLDEVEDEETGEWVERFIYDIPFFADGDVLAVTTTDESEIAYTFDSEENAFIAENGERIDWSSVEVSHSQYSSPWTLGSDNYFTVSYMGADCDVRVSIVAHEASFEVAAALELNAPLEVNLDDNAQYYSFTPDASGWYSFYSSSVGDGDHDSYAELYDADGNPLTESEDDGEEWNFFLRYELQEGKTYYLKALSWTGLETYLIAVEEVAAPTALNASVKEGASLIYEDPSMGSWETDEDEETGETSKYFWFFSSAISRILNITATYENGEEKALSEDDADFYYDCRDWQPGNSYPVTVSYMGQTCEVLVPVANNPVASISLRPNKAYELVENTKGEMTSYYDDETGTEHEYFDYNLPYWSAGDQLTVTEVDGTKTVYTYDEDSCEFVADGDRTIFEGDVSRWSSQYKNPWTVGSNNHFTVEYMGASYEVPVKIVANPVASISFAPAQPYALPENGYGWYDIDDYEEEYFDYERPDWAQGDTLTVYDKKGTAKAYVFDEGPWDFVAKDGSTLDWDYLRTSDNQYNYHWTLGDDNFFTVEYMGAACDVPVTIVENTVASIRFERDGGIELLNQIEGNQEDGYFDYYYPSFREGDKLIVEETSGETIEYVYQLNNGSYAFVSSEGKVINLPDVRLSGSTASWEPDGENYLYLNYWGSEVQVPVSIVEPTAADFDKTDVFTDSSVYLYTGSAIKPRVSVYINDTSLVEGTHYAVTFGNNVNVGTATATVKGLGVFEGATKTVSFTIAKDAQTISASDVTVAMGKTATVSARVTKGNGKLSYTSNNTSVARVDANTGVVTPVNAGVTTIQVKAAGTSAYNEVVRTVRVTVTKGANAFNAKLVKKTQSAKSNKKTTIKAKKAFKVTKNLSGGKVTYKKVSGNKKITVSKTGKITVKKGLKKGTYKIKVKLTAAATANYNAASKTLTLKIKVK